MSGGPQSYSLGWTRAGVPMGYAVSPEDTLNLARAVAHEGAPQEKVAWALLSRFAHLYKRGYNTLSAFLKAYVQPINPRWFPEGDLHRKEIARLEAGSLPDKAQRIRDERARAGRRVLQARKTWGELSPEHRRTTERVLSGAVAAPSPAVTDYRASKATRDDSPEAARSKAIAFAADRNLVSVDVGAGFGPGVNWFFRVPNYQVGGLRVGPGVPFVGTP